MHASIPPNEKMRGFTLLELLVALSIFALVSALAYGGLSSVMQARTVTAIHSDQMARLQKAFNIMSRDLEQANGRAIRDSYGTAQSGFAASDYGGNALEFTRGGWNNPFPSAKRIRSYQQRVAYRVEEKNLMRVYWFDLDLDYDSPKFEAPVLAGVQGMELRFLDRDKKWQTGWPPQGSEDQVLPRAVEVTLDLETLGKVSRLFLLAQGVPMEKQGAPNTNQGGN